MISAWTRNPGSDFQNLQLSIMQQLSRIIALSLFLSSAFSSSMPSLHSSVDIYIIPSAECDHCPANETFFTLEQLSLNEIIGSIKTKATLQFLPGNHTLASKLTIHGHIESLLFLSSATDSVIICEDLGSFTISFVNYVEILNLTFFNCKGNQIEWVKNLTMQGCMFLIQKMGENESNYSKKVSNTSVTVSNVPLSTVNSEVLLTCNHSIITMNLCFFSSKKGTALFVNSRSNLTIISTTFHNSDFSTKFRARSPALIQFLDSNVSIKNSVITNNTGEYIVYALKCNISFENCRILNNIGTFGVIFVVKSDISLEGVTFIENQGSFLVKNCLVKLGGSNLFSKCTQEYCGTFSSSQSQIDQYGNTIVCDNHSQQSGGGMYISESLLSIHGTLKVVNNTANYSGGGIFLHQADMFCHGHCIFAHNKAIDKGGGIHAYAAVIMVKFDDKWTQSKYDYITLTVMDNEAMFGGGAYFEVSSKLYSIQDDNFVYSIEFYWNSATYGGAIFVNDKTYPKVCESNSSRLHYALTGCFFQTLYSNEHEREVGKRAYNLFFDNNTADQGSVLFGGLLDRCTVDDLYDQYAQTGSSLANALAHFQSKYSSVTAEELASHAVRICICNGTIPNCNPDYRPEPIMIKKGEHFNINVVAVDQVNRPVNAIIRGSLSGTKSILGEGKGVQITTEGCTKLTYNISSPYDSVNLGLYARKGPCKDMGLSKVVVKINFTKCTCPIGFQQSKQVSTKCHCDCHENLEPYVQLCDYLTDSLKKKSDSWIGFINDTNNIIYIVHPNCPYDFCFSFKVAVIKLNEPNGIDAQCDYNRSGLLCGGCMKGLSLSAGTPQCVRCPKHWPALLVISILAGLFGGILLVVILLLFNLTVAIGTLNGLIFYANIVLSNRSTFLPFSKPNFVTVFIHLLNTRLGLEFCLYEGMDEYGKTWLSVGFPLYLLSLVFTVITVSPYSSKCTHLLGRSNPVATLASLVLLTYEGLLQTTIDIFSFTDLRYLNKSQPVTVRVWQPDATVKYLQHKHIPLFLIGIAIVALGLMYTTLLFSWQWILSFPDKMIFSWIRNTKLNSFIESYHAPYKPKYRYWTGLLLFIRALQNITIAANVSGNPQNSLLIVCILISCLIMFKSYLGIMIYKRKSLDYLEMASYFNLLFFTMASFYSLGDRQSQKKAAYISVSVALVMFIGVIVSHIHITLSKLQCYKTLSLSIYHLVKRADHDAIYNHYSLMTPTNVPTTPTLSEVSMSLTSSQVCSMSTDSESTHPRNGLDQYAEGHMTRNKT